MDEDISYRFENILQTPEFVTKFESFLSTDIDNNQHSIDRATLDLSNLLVSGAEQAGSPVKLDMKKKINKTAGSRRNCNKKRASLPKWHDLSCCEAHRKVCTTAWLLKNDQNNSYLRSKLKTFTKEYNKLVKLKHKEFVDNLFSELDSMENNNPRGYMQLIKSLREGNFDKNTPDDTSGVSPSDWQTHFSKLLTQNVDQVKKNNLIELIKQNIDLFKTNLDDPFSAEEFNKALKDLKNNKSSSFDQITNEILKLSCKIYKNAFLKLFNSIGRVGLYPVSWKKDILHPIHKSNEKDDPNNFRGISIASCFGKLFIKLMINRLQYFLDDKNAISKQQGSGKKNTRTSDHLMVIKYLIDKIVKGQKKKLYACFVDVKKAYDCTNREILFHKLLMDYGVGGNFLRVLQSMYDNAEVFVRVNEGLLQPILTTV